MTNQPDKPLSDYEQGAMAVFGLTTCLSEAELLVHVKSLIPPDDLHEPELLEACRLATEAMKTFRRWPGVLKAQPACDAAIAATEGGSQ